MTDEEPAIAGTASPMWSTPNDLLVELYEAEAFLVDTVCGFLLRALTDGDAAIVVASADHRRSFEAALESAGIDVEAALREGRYSPLDARELLSSFMVDGPPDATRFLDAIGPVMDRASKGGRRIRVYGEMVALLLDDGDLESAMALEAMWNDLARIRTFVLLCSHPMGSFDNDRSVAYFRNICNQHTNVIPSEVLRLPSKQAEEALVTGDEIGSLRDEVGARRDRSSDRRGHAATDGTEHPRRGTKPPRRGTKPPRTVTKPPRTVTKPPRTVTKPPSVPRCQQAM